MGSYPRLPLLSELLASLDHSESHRPPLVSQILDLFLTSYSNSHFCKRKNLFFAGSFSLGTQFVDDDVDLDLHSKFLEGSSIWKSSCPFVSLTWFTATPHPCFLLKVPRVYLWQDQIPVLFLVND